MLRLDKQVLRNRDWRQSSRYYCLRQSWPVQCEMCSILLLRIKPDVQVMNWVIRCKARFNAEPVYNWHGIHKITVLLDSCLVLGTCLRFAGQSCERLRSHGQSTWTILHTYRITNRLLTLFTLSFQISEATARSWPECYSEYPTSSGIIYKNPVREA